MKYVAMPESGSDTGFKQTCETNESVLGRKVCLICQVLPDQKNSKVSPSQKDIDSNLRKIEIKPYKSQIHGEPTKDC